MTTQRTHSPMWAALKNSSCIQARPTANAKNIWNILAINSLLPFFSAVLVACSSKPQDKEIRKFNETLLIQYYIIRFVHALKHQYTRNEKKSFIVGTYFLFLSLQNCLSKMPLKGYNGIRFSAKILK